MFRRYRPTQLAPRTSWFAALSCALLLFDAQPVHADNVVGYYDMSSGQGVANQVAPIVAAGFTPVQLFDLTAANLSGIDVLFVQNSSNSGFGGEYLSRFASSSIQSAVNAGMVLVIHDRRVTNAHTILPGGGAIQFVRHTAAPRSTDIDILDLVIANGPGGMLNDASLDGGNFSNHGYAQLATLPASARALLSNGLPTQIVTFSYRFGMGAVIYSTIPLDFYLGGGGNNPPRNNLTQIYAPNILAYAMSLRTQDTTLTVDPATGQYGGMTTLTATLLTTIGGDPVSGRTVSFFLNGDPVDSVPTDSNGVATLVDVSLGTLGAGSYLNGVSANFAGDDSFNPSSGSADLTVTPAPLSITADDATKLYGAPLPPFTATYSGFVLGEGPGVLTGMLTFSTPATASSPVGTYPVTPGGLTSTNYDITFISGTLTVNPAPLSITADDATKLYGAPLPPFTATYSGFVLGEGPGVLSGMLTFSTPATASSPVGTYPVTPGGLTSTNYDITFNPGTLTVTYNICLLYDRSRVVNSGSTLPVRLRLCDFSGRNVSSPSIGVHAIDVVMVPTMAVWPAEDSGNSNPGGNFRLTGGGYHFNLKTDKSMPSGMYNLMFTVDGDPLSHAAPLQIR